MADTVAVMNNGVIEQMGPPAELYESPHTTFVANFLGQSNLFPAAVLDLTDSEIVLEDPDGRYRMPRSRVAPGVKATAGSRVLVGVRPEKISIATVNEAEPPPAHGNFVEGTVESVSFLGVSTQYQVTTRAGDLIGVFAQNRDTHGILPVGESVRLWWEPHHGFVLDGSSDINAGLESLADAEVGG